MEDLTTLTERMRLMSTFVILHYDVCIKPIHHLTGNVLKLTDVCHLAVTACGHSKRPGSITCLIPVIIVFTVVFPSTELRIESLTVCKHVLWLIWNSQPSQNRTSAVAVSHLQSCVSTDSSSTLYSNKILWLVFMSSSRGCTKYLSSSFQYPYNHIDRWTHRPTICYHQFIHQSRR